MTPWPREWFAKRPSNDANYRSGWYSRNRVFLRLSYGSSDLRHLRLCGYEPGIIPPGITVKEWKTQKMMNMQLRCYLEKRFSPTPMVAGMLFGQLWMD